MSDFHSVRWSRSKQTKHTDLFGLHYSRYHASGDGMFTLCCVPIPVGLEGTFLPEEETLDKVNCQNCLRQLSKLRKWELFNEEEFGMRAIEEWLAMEWPMKMYEGSIEIARTTTGNQTSRYQARLVICIYPQHGLSGIERVDAFGETADAAFTELWRRTKIKVRELVERNELPQQLAWWHRAFNRGEGV